MTEGGSGTGSDYWFRIRIWEAQKHVDPEHCMQEGQRDGTRQASACMVQIGQGWNRRRQEGHSH
jgi:hypothetical protein